MSPGAGVHDLVIRGGVVIDGTGDPARRADVAIECAPYPPNGDDTTARRLWLESARLPGIEG
jgi:hypothetical protein